MAADNEDVPWTLQVEYNLNDYLCADEIPDQIVYDLYTGIDFVDDDFYCNQKHYEED